MSDGLYLLLGLFLGVFLGVMVMAMLNVARGGEGDCHSGEDVLY